jgi:hypothetical protein
MKKTLVVTLCLLLIASFAMAKKVDRGVTVNKRVEPVRTDNFIPELGIQPRAAAQGTTQLCYFTFDSGPSCVTDGFVSVDVTAQTGDYWYVATDNDPTDPWLDGGSFGGLTPIEGNKSMWCGAAPDASSPTLCGYAALPGYGNGWNQGLCSDPIGPSIGYAITMSVKWDSEPGYDATTLEIDNNDDNWIALYGGTGTWDGVGTDTLTIAVNDTLHTGTIRFRFHFTSDGAWSDQDGLWNTDGAFLLDEVSVADTAIAPPILPYEDFESYAQGTGNTAYWDVCTPAGYGDYAGLFPGVAEVQEDPCQTDLTCMWAFHNGSLYDYTCGGYPSQRVVPYEATDGQYISNEIWSPDFAVIGAGAVWELRFDVYRDLKLNALLFYVWHVRSIVAGCPGGWEDYNFVYYGGGEDWLRSTFGVGQFIDPAASHVNVAIGVVDMCLYWCGIYGDGTCHAHAPLIDNVELYRVNQVGPQWQVRDIDLFQDTFSHTTPTKPGLLRADMANDIRAGDNPAIVPGDSAVVEVTDPVSGLNTDATTGKAAVYAFVRVDHAGHAHDGVVSPALVDEARYAHVGTATAGGYTWAQINMDTCYTANGSVVEDKYCVDLNDNYFVPGDTVWFFVGGENTLSQWTYWALPIPTPTNQTDDFDEAGSNPDEITFLPAGGPERGGDILYVDGMNFRGSQGYFDSAFDMMAIRELIDRYDIRGPSSAVANHPGARYGVTANLTYRKIIYTCGDLETAFGDGSGTPDKSDDTGMLKNFLDGSAQDTFGGVYLNGDDVSDVWNGWTSTSATALRTTYMNFTLVANDHVPTVGISPLGVGTPLLMFSDGLGPDTLVAYGGCPLINDFDVIGPAGTSVLEMSYVRNDGGTPATAPAVLSQRTLNGNANSVGFVLSGFAFHYIRDDRPAGIPDRAEHMWKIITWLENVVPYPVGANPAVTAKNELRQNYPNPFNPTTTIKYQVKNSGHVSLKIYNVAGQLVRTLVDEQVKAGQVYEAQWQGLNNANQPVSSGVYFYKLVTNGYTQTKKMVLLK